MAVPIDKSKDAAAGLRLDCRQFRGDRPCAASVPGWCPADCALYSPMGSRILIVKLGALGDVIRTAALLPGLKRNWPISHITWITRPAGTRMLANHPLIDRLLTFDAETLCHIEHERFDLCISLDKEPAPAALAMRVRALDKRGIGLSSHGTPMPLNEACRHYFALGLDNELKFRGNDCSYAQLVYEALGIVYAGEQFSLYPSDADIAAARAVWSSAGVRDEEVVVGLNTGAGSGFANKSWPPEKFAALARLLGARGRRVALFGGPGEREINRKIAGEVAGIIDTGADHPELQFAALVKRATALVTGDTMAMHVAIALGVPAIVLFGPTCSQEIDLFGRGEKIVTGVSCSPCYKRTCELSPNCMDDIDVERVLAAVERLAPGGRMTALPGRFIENATSRRPLPVLAGL